MIQKYPKNLLIRISEEAPPGICLCVSCGARRGTFVINSTPDIVALLFIDLRILIMMIMMSMTMIMMKTKPLRLCHSILALRLCSCPGCVSLRTAVRSQLSGSLWKGGAWWVGGDPPPSSHRVEEVGNSMLYFQEGENDNKELFCNACHSIVVKSNF